MSRRPGFQFGGLQGFRKFTLAPEPGDKLTNRAEPVYPPISVESMETWGSVEADPRQPEETAPARAIRIAREVAPPVAAAPIVRRAAPVVAEPEPEPESRELTIPVNRPSQDDTARALWEIFNRTENPADFVRADLATPRPAARAGGTVDRALRVAREAGGSLDAYVDPMGGVMAPGENTAPAPEWYDKTANALAVAGRAVGEPMRVASENYLRNVGKAFQESRGAIDQSFRDITGERGPLPQAGAPINYGLGVLGMGLSPLTGAATSAGHATTQMTGNPQIGQRVEFLGNVIDPSHIALAAKSAVAAAPMARALEVAREVQAPAREPLFNYSRLGNVPHVRQFDLPRYEPARGVPERTQAITKDPDVRERMLQTIEEGEKLGGSRWYNADPLREVFVQEHGRERGDEAFRKYMDFVAATSPRSEVGANARNASYYFHRAMTGKGMPEVGERNPQPYGHMAQRLHQMNAQRVAGPGWDPLNNPKPASFVENLVGNQRPVTVDTHAFRLPAIIAQDPRFLETAFQVDKTAPKQNIAQMVARGELPIEEAAQRPAYWQAQPKENEYAAMEQYYKSLGQDLGLTPAQTQAAAWVGGGKLTGLKSDESKPFLKFFEDRIYKTAIEKNMDPQDVMRAFVRGEMPLYADGGSVVDRALRVARKTGGEVSKTRNSYSYEKADKMQSSEQRN